ncbi:GTPase-activating protein gyp8 [Sporothrix epigloea]|uniref:GTPase-activating protein gyp8 n=1 Tax=Sporothrix epigloea TaxID=1892477 RepID=A0ABP0DFD9_9PEZI
MEEANGLDHVYSMPPVDGDPGLTVEEAALKKDARQLDEGVVYGRASNEKVGMPDSMPVTALESDTARSSTSSATAATAATAEATPIGQSSPQLHAQTMEENVERDGLAATAKKQAIREACVQGDFARLQQLAGSEGGFLTDGLRELAWPFLLGIPVEADGHIDLAKASAAAGIAADESSHAWESLPPHRDEEQVQLDVDRAFVYYPQHASSADELRQKRALSELIGQVLRRFPYLCYFQGFHDICQVFLLVLPPPICMPAVARLAVLRIRDFMLPTIDAAVQQLLLLPDILRKADPALWDHLRLAQHPRPFFALSGTLTMYAHDVQSLGAITRLFDVMLARPPAFSLYLFAAIVRAQRDALFATPADEPEMLHHILSKLPGQAGRSRGDGNGDDGDDSDDEKQNQPQSLDTLIADAVQLMADYPPHELLAWRSVPSSSVLKTADDSCMSAAAKPLATGLTMADGERLYHKHVHQLDAAERRRQQLAQVRKLLHQYRGPLRALGMAIFVGAVAIALRRAGAGTGTKSPPILGLVSRCSSLLTRLGIHSD